MSRKTAPLRPAPIRIENLLRKLHAHNRLDGYRLRHPVRRRPLRMVLGSWFGVRGQGLRKSN